MFANKTLNVLVINIITINKTISKNCNTRFLITVHNFIKLINLRIKMKYKLNISYVY